MGRTISGFYGAGALRQAAWHRLCNSTRMMNDQNVRSQLEEMLSAMAVPYSDGPVGVSGWQRRREQSSESLQQCIDELQARLDHLRVSIKYLMFDVEATRRENRSLRRLVEQAYEDHDDEMV